MKWEKVKLINCCNSLTDGDHQAPPKSSDGVPFVTISNIINNQFDFDNTMFVPYEYYENLDEKRKPRKNDILYSVVGSYGIPVLIKNNSPFVFQRHIAILKPKEEVNAKFLYYTMLSNEFYVKADNVALGAAQRTISLTALRNIEINVPDIEVQHKIANILSAYDDLIENNQKQIKLLEEAAQRLYKEWFVDLRFPGYENTPIINGMPEGWEEEEINKIFNIKYGKTLPTNKIKNSGKYPVYGANGIIGYYNQKNCNDYVVLITSRGNGSGEVSRTHDKEAFVTNNSFIIMPVNDLIKLPFTYQLMKTINFKRICTGSAQPQLTNKSINILKVVLPSDELVLKFCQYTEIYYEKIENLLSQNKRLIEARDRLLTKLMSGEIEV